MNRFQLLFRIYISPSKAFSRILDEGRLIFAVLAAVMAMLALQVPRAADEFRNQAEIVARLPAPPPATPSLWDVLDRFTARNPSQYFSPLLALAICFVPVAILLMTLLEHPGGFSTILFRDYLSLLVCILFAWTAPYLLLAFVNQAFGFAYPPGQNQPALWWAAQIYFFTLASIAIRTLYGTSFGRAIVASAAAWCSSVAGLFVYSLFGHVTAYLASPFLLYYLYSALGPEFRSLGTGLRSRQGLKKRLEIATLNPRDADALYQLGLIYMQRRQYEPAAEFFQKALNIDPQEADAHYQLARIARQQSRYEDALRHCSTAARIDDKHSSSEVWREIGIISFLSGSPASAREAFEKYLSRRPYDPEGQCWYGRTLAKLELYTDARRAFEQAIEAVRTMPPARKRQLRSWESESRRELKNLPPAHP